MLIVVMGVSGCGKTTVGQLLAQRLSIPFFDGDDFHSAENIAKMRQGIPLTDADRKPWLQQLASLLKEQENGKGGVLACSALKEDYRLLLQEGIGKKITWVHLEGSESLLQERLQRRSNHFMASGLLASQLATLEKPVYAHCISISASPGEIVENIITKIQGRLDTESGEHI